MKNPNNLVSGKDQYSSDIEGFFFEGMDGSQMAFWTAYTGGVSAMHTHPFDEYMVSVYGKYTVLLGGKEVVLMPGDEFHIPKGTEHGCKRIAGTRTIHAFGGRRIQKTP
jgi:quercetin dioxygenase-like cupin family protein